MKNKSANGKVATFKNARAPTSPSANIAKSKKGEYRKEDDGARMALEILKARGGPAPTKSLTLAYISHRSLHEYAISV